MSKQFPVLRKYTYLEAESISLYNNDVADENTFKTLLRNTPFSLVVAGEFYDDHDARSSRGVDGNSMVYQRGDFHSINFDTGDVTLKYNGGSFANYTLDDFYTFKIIASTVGAQCVCGLYRDGVSDADKYYLTDSVLVDSGITSTVNMTPDQYFYLFEDMVVNDVSHPAKTWLSVTTQKDVTFESDVSTVVPIFI